MNLSHMLEEMCRNALGPADLRAISKSRGLGEQAANSPLYMANVFLSETGVADIMRTLSAAEIATLHLMHSGQFPVDVSFFERVYGTQGAGQHTNYGTFTQRFKPIFDLVQRNLVRKGLLILTIAPDNSSKAKLELWRYVFPPEFAPFLPPLLATIQHTAQGEFNADRFREALVHMLQGGPVTQDLPVGVRLLGGHMVVNGAPFKAPMAREWERRAWEGEIRKAEIVSVSKILYLPQTVMYQGLIAPKISERTPTPLPFLLSALGQLAPDAWVAPEALTIPLDIVYGTKVHPAAADICDIGWKSGCLARLVADNRVYYRLLIESDQPARALPQRYLHNTKDAIFVDLATVPYDALELINRIATLHFQAGSLQAIIQTSDLVDALDDLRNHEIVRFLREHNADFRHRYDRILASWGSLIIHEHLLVARITDLSLRVRLEKAFEAEVGTVPALIWLGDEFVAFPKGWLGEVEKVVKKNGHVVKTVQAK